MARQRDYRAEYRARVERAAERGLTRAQAAGQAKRAALPSVTELRARGALPSRPRAERRPLQSVETPAGRIARSGDKSTVRRLVEDAAREGKSVVIRAKFQRPDGSWRTATLGQDGGGSDGLARASMYGDSAKSYGRAPSSGRRPGKLTRGGRQSVEVRTGSNGMDAAELLALFDLYESEWDAIYDLWDEAEYQ